MKKDPRLHQLRRMKNCKRSGAILAQLALEVTMAEINTKKPKKEVPK